MMKNILYFGLAICFLTVFPVETRAATFIEGLEDVPVMDGLKQVPNDSITFGNEESRFVEAILIGENFNFSKVEKFYKDTLPQMGWTFQGKKKNVLTFFRDRESIEIVREEKKPLTIRITVKSRN